MLTEKLIKKYLYCLTKTEFEKSIYDCDKCLLSGECGNEKILEKLTQTALALLDENDKIIKDLTAAHRGYLDQIAQLQQEIEQLKKQNSNILSAYKDKEYEIALLKDFKDLVITNQKHPDDVWYWRSGEENHIGSMVNSLVVVIHADDLRELLAKRDKALEIAREALKASLHLYSLGVITINHNSDNRKKAVVDESKRGKAREIERQAIEALTAIEALGRKKLHILNECYEQYGNDLDGCSTQEREGCGSCVIALGGNEK